jgi:hypothetical protein
VNLRIGGASIERLEIDIGDFLELCGLAGIERATVE